MKKVIYFIVPAVLSYAITMFLLWILLVPMTGLFSEFDIILFTWIGYNKLDKKEKDRL